MLNTFEDDFVEVSGWPGYEHNLCWRSAEEYVWHELPRNVFTNISRRVVSVVSIKGDLLTVMYVVYYGCVHPGM